MAETGLDWMQAQYSEFAKVYTDAWLEMSRLPMEMTMAMMDANQKAMSSVFEQMMESGAANPFAGSLKLIHDDGYTKYGMAAGLFAAPAEPESAAPVEETQSTFSQVIPAAAVPEKDDLTAISGIGPKLASDLNDMGIFRFSQIAKWTEDDLADFDDNPTLKSRILRNDWIGQAGKLADA